MMKKHFQAIVLIAYRLMQASGILSTIFGQRISSGAYFMYKKIFEPSIDHLSYVVPSGSTVLDVGANVGFFTVLFSKWVTRTGQVIAIEPELRNIRELKKSIARSRCRNVEIIEAAAAETEGDLFLSLNPNNPADHRLAEAGIPIKAITIDALLRARNWPEVSLIKIDVQGAEPRVIAGASETIARFFPTFFLEIDDEALSAAGFQAQELIDPLRALGYEMYSQEKGGLDSALNNQEALLKRKDLGYADFVFIHNS